MYMGFWLFIGWCDVISVSSFPRTTMLSVTMSGVSIWQLIDLCAVLLEAGGRVEGNVLGFGKHILNE